MGRNYPLIFSQTQMGINDSYADSDDEERSITESSKGPQFVEISKQLNNVFDDTNKYLSVELKAIITHRYSTSVLEFKVEYTNGNVTWYRID